MGRNNIYKTCLSKVRFGTKEEAEKEADRIFCESGLSLYTYKCPLCNGYHFTSKKRKHSRIFS